jgi:hypothetical protein
MVTTKKPKEKHTERKPKRKRPPRKFKCEFCEKLVMKHKHIKVKKNYPFGKKSKPQITYTHRKDGGYLVELKRKDERKI